jgi:hypothetical protein
MFTNNVKIGTGVKRTKPAPKLAEEPKYASAEEVAKIRADYIARGLIIPVTEAEAA